MTDFEEFKLLDYSDEELLRYITAAKSLLPSDSLCSVKVLSSTLVAKPVSNDELAGYDMGESLGIRVPAVRRVIKRTEHEKLFIVMDRIRGVTLDEAWTQLGWISTISTALQLRKFVQAMRSRTNPEAGGLATGVCNSIWLDDFFGLPPRPAPELITSYFAFWLQYSRSQRWTYPNPEPSNMHLLPAQARSFVFTHQDLAPRNILLDNNGKLWLIDWYYSGWYPVYFEYVGMMNFNSFNTVWSWIARIRWHVFCWISVGIYRKERRAMELTYGLSKGDPAARYVIPGMWNYFSTPS